MKKDIYIKIINGDGKQWVFPQTDLRLALNLYQPSSVKGILLKKYLPNCYAIPGFKKLLKKVLKIENCKLEVPENILDILTSLYKQEDICFAYFSGTPCVHQKATIQIMSCGKILGYAKFSEQNVIKLLFQKEEQTLEYLLECGVPNIPRCLCCEQLDDGKTVFVQDTKKTTRSKIVHEFGEMHVQFLEELAKRTKVTCDYSATDYFGMVQEFKKNLILLQNLKFDLKIMRECIEVVEESLRDEKNFSGHHGDFTPWNTFVMENAELYVFDFEYFKRTYPKHIDAFHFYTQTSIFQKKKNAKEIMKGFEKEFVYGKFSSLFENPYVAYIQYLVSIMAFYIERDRMKNNTSSLQNFEIWYEIMVLLHEKIIIVERDTNEIT